MTCSTFFLMGAVGVFAAPMHRHAQRLQMRSDVVLCRAEIARGHNLGTPGLEHFKKNSSLGLNVKRDANPVSLGKAWSSRTPRELPASAAYAILSS